MGKTGGDSGMAQSRVLGLLFAKPTLSLHRMAGGKAGRELYDHTHDPEEINNLAEQAEHASLVSSLSKQLKPFVQLKLYKRPK